MSWSEFMDQLIALLSHFTALGPIGGVLLSMIEAFFPPLPLALFVTINVYAFGFLFGYIYSLIGTVIGSICMFYLIRWFGRRYIQKRLEKSKRLGNMFHWIHERGFLPIFVLLTFPFTPSILVCGLAALADVDHIQYIFATIFGKMLMVLSLSFIGYNVSSFFQQPLKSVLFILGTLLVSYIGRFAIGRYEKHIEHRRLRESEKHHHI